MGPWIGQVAYRFSAPLDVEKMTFSQLFYWNEWDKAMTDAEKRANKV
jgi:hypothetical protein